MKRTLSFLVLSIILVGCGSKKKSVASSGPSFEWEEKADPNRKPVERKASDAGVEKSLLRYDRKDIEDFLEDWWGVPHRMGGMTKKGVDCSGLMCVIYDDLYDDPFEYRRAQDIYSELQPIRTQQELLPGDLVFFKIGGVRIDHVGIYLGDGDFAHASSSRGVMVSNLSQNYWKKRYFRGGRKQ